MNWENNLSNIIEAINEAQHKGIQILCLPELCITGYGCEDMFHSTWIAEKALDKLGHIVPETKDIFVTVGLPVWFEDKCYNAICLIYNQQVLGFYAKQKLANDGVHYEPRWFTPWPTGKAASFHYLGTDYPIGHFTLDLFDIKIGFEICEDAWREDRPAGHTINHGVDLFLNPSASHFAFGKAEFRESLVVKSSERFDCTYLYTNLLGNEAGRMIYDGDILIAKKGQLIGRNRRLSFKNFNLLSAVIDFNGNQDGEKAIQLDHPNPFAEFGKAASLALFDYMRKSRSKGFVLSLSGGADSSSIAVLVAEMVKNGLEELGFDGFNVKSGLDLTEGDAKKVVYQLLHTAYQGTVNSSEDTFNSAKSLAESLGARFYDWKIDEEVGAYRDSIEKAIGRELTWETDDIALQNIQARARSPIIWMLANIEKCLLLSTSNRSEGDVGYATMDGDTSGSISPIAAVDKSFILSWLTYAENELGYKGLKHVNSLAPTAELRPQEMMQTDEADLMPYSVLVDIERKAVRDKKSPLEVYDRLKGGYPDHVLLKQWITKFFRMWSINQWKRERIAPSFHLDDFNVDPRTWCRFPILSSGFQEELDELSRS
ncbi:NAD(+) synthase [Marinoscillum sp. MHG1-6]|uniref:NAD(+) synthase n=1 Tax=Marinoscillum sp. MHG1-6 TaxID=2959627 RepID=UPI00280B2D10|nr:NAD(+) synthase [Marinoscillum sp. MHG1-6]